MIADTYIRVNQLGCRPDDPKTAVIMSTEPIEGDFHITDAVGQVVYAGWLSADWGTYLAFPHHYTAVFTGLREPGTYHLRLDSGETSPTINVGDGLFGATADSLVRFFRVQRCGNNTPELHAPCHLNDATTIVGGPDDGEAVDATGGWHDASDYIKFVITTAHAAYLMLLTDEVILSRSPDDSFPDLLHEARIGLDWMIKMHYAPGGLLSQVQDGGDHNVGVRMPEDDTLDMQRPAYYAPSRALCGSFSAAMAAASRAFRAWGDKRYAALCLKHAKQVYKLASSEIPEGDGGPDSMYIDSDGGDNLALAAAELYIATGDAHYLEDAARWVEQGDGANWLSWGDLGNVALARLIPYHDGCATKLRKSLAHFDSLAASNPFAYPIRTYPWGSASVQMGIAALAILYQEATGSDEFYELAVRQRDFALGANSHGVSFLSGFGTNSARNFHNQVAMLTGTILPGGFAEGYIDDAEFRNSGIILRRDDRFLKFQSEVAVYHDDENDYLSNEPTITGTAQALFVFSWFASRGSDNSR